MGAGVDKRALAQDRAAIDADPTSAYLTSGLAELYAKTGRIRDAVVEAQDIIKRGLNVRQIEIEMRKEGRRQARDVGGTSRAKDADTKALEKKLSDALGLEVAVDHRADGGGTLRIKYRDLEQLDAVLRKLDRP